MTESHAIDPVTLAVVHNGLMQVADEMDLTQERTAFSPIISEGMDRANGLYNAENGDIIVQGRRGLPLFVGVMRATVRDALDYGMDLEEGDVAIMNDPYMGGTHLMDMKCLRPFYYKGKLWCYMANSAHWADIGGSVPGGFASKATEIHQEGLRLPPIRVMRDNEYQDEIVQMILANCRVPGERLGDLRSQVGALLVGERRLTKLLDRYGIETVEAVIEEMRERSSRQMQAHIETIPDGTYSVSGEMDNDGITADPLHIQLDMTVKGSTLHFDLSGSDEPCSGPINTPWATTETSIYIAVMHFFPDVPINAGCLSSIVIERPEGTFLDARYPRPCSGAAAEVSQRVCESALIALGKALPSRAHAGAFGTSGNMTLGGYDPEKDSSYVMYLFTGGGYGGNWQGDGFSNGVNIIAFAKAQPIEILESSYPVLFERNQLREDSAGAGRNRGGLGYHYRVRLTRGNATASFMMDRGLNQPPGLHGGGAAVCTKVEISQDGVATEPQYVTKGSDFLLEPGDWIEVRTPGGGGLGDPKERDSSLIQRDVTRGYITAAAAEHDYSWEPAG